MEILVLLDNIIVTANQIADATGIRRCSLLVNMVQMLGNLKEALVESQHAATEREALLAEQVSRLEESKAEKHADGNVRMFGAKGEE